jgi:hypothetical protein
MGEHTTQFLVGEILRGVTCHDDEMSSTCVGIDVLVVDDAHDVMATLDVPRLSHFVECWLEFRSLGSSRPTSTDERREDTPLCPRHEQENPRRQVADQDVPGGDVREKTDGQPEHEHGDEPQRQNCNGRNEGKKRGAIDVAVLHRPGAGLSKGSRFHRLRTSDAMDLGFSSSHLPSVLPDRE